jgi:hypothetical protein
LTFVALPNVVKIFLWRAAGTVKSLPGMIGLLVTRGAAAGTYFESSSEVLRIGRDGAGNDLTIPDVQVSAWHASIIREGDRYLLIDNGSFNGTTVVRSNGRILLNESNGRRSELATGDVLELAGISMTVTLCEDGKAPSGDKKGDKWPQKAPPDIKWLLADWRANAEVYAKAHMRMAVRYEKRHYWLGIPSTVMGAVVGTTIFGSLEKAAASWPLKVGLAAVSITSACLVALQTFLRYLERAGQHNLAQAEYGEIAHALELLSMTEKTREDWVKALEGLSQRLDSIKGKAPLPDNVDALEREADELAERYREQVRASVRKPPATPFMGRHGYVGSPPRGLQPPPVLPPPPPRSPFVPAPWAAGPPAAPGELQAPGGPPELLFGQAPSPGLPQPTSLKETELGTPPSYGDRPAGSYAEQLRSFESAVGSD